MCRLFRTLVAVCCHFLFCPAAFAVICGDYNWDAPCPKGWTVISDICQAPLSYQGPCAMRASVGTTLSHKREFANACKVTWLCVDSCEQDYTGACPAGWTESGNGACDAPLMYSGRCKAHAQMWGDEFKEEFGARCDLRWPCKKMCEEDFRQPCPTAWVLIDGICVATTTYSGPCVPFAQLGNLTEKDKQAFGERCAADFCKRTVSTLGDHECEINEATACPIGWKHIGSLEGFCHDAQYQGPCRPLISTRDLNAIGKRNFGTQCGVQWSCKERDVLPTVGSTSEQEAAMLPSGPVASDGRLYAIA